MVNCIHKAIRYNFLIIAFFSLSGAMEKESESGAQETEKEFIKRTQHLRQGTGGSSRHGPWQSLDLPNQVLSLEEKRQHALEIVSDCFNMDSKKYVLTLRDKNSKEKKKLWDFNYSSNSYLACCFAVSPDLSKLIIKHEYGSSLDYYIAPMPTSDQKEIKIFYYKHYNWKKIFNTSHGRARFLAISNNDNMFAYIDPDKMLSIRKYLIIWAQYKIIHTDVPIAQVPFDIITALAFNMQGTKLIVHGKSNQLDDLSKLYQIYDVPSLAITAKIKNQN